MKRKKFISESSDDQANFRMNKKIAYMIDRMTIQKYFHRSDHNVLKANEK